MVGMATNSGEGNGGKEDKNNKRIDAAMKAKNQSFKRRKDCVMKKSMELSVLCDIKVCAIIVEPNGKIETWPENKYDVMEIVKLYQGSGDRKDGCNKKKVVVECGNEAATAEADHHVGLDLQKESDDAYSWIEELSETSLDDFLTEISAEINAVGNKIDILKRTSRVDDQMNDHKKRVVVECGNEAAAAEADHCVGLNLQKESDDADSWIEGLSETSLNDFLTEINAKINAVGSKIDILKRTTTVDDQMNDHSTATAVVLYDGEKAMDHSSYDPINDDQMNDGMPAEVVVFEGDEAVEQSIIKDQFNPTCFNYDQQNSEEWLNTLLNWNRFEEDALMFDSEFWQ